MNRLELNVNGINLVAYIASHGGEQWVAIKPLCEALGLKVQTQQKRIHNNPQFKVAPISGVPSSGGPQETLCIPVRQIGMWICTINARKVKDSVRSNLLLFQEHLQSVIHDAITGRVSAEKVVMLEQQVAHLTQALAENNKIVGQLIAEVKYLRVGADRFESADAFAAASRLSHQRWVKKDRKIVQ